MTNPTTRAMVVDAPVHGRAVIEVGGEISA